jgi:hypothetical protein
LDARDQFHGQVGHRRGAGVVSLDEVGVPQPAGGEHLAAEAADGLRVLAPGTTHQFQGHDLAEMRVQGAVDGAHAAGAERFEQPVRPHLAHPVRGRRG